MARCWAPHAGCSAVTRSPFPVPARRRQRRSARVGRVVVLSEDRFRAARPRRVAVDAPGAGAARARSRSSFEPGDPAATGPRPVAPLTRQAARRRDGALPLANVGLHVTRLLSRRFGHDRETATRVCATEAAARLGGDRTPDGTRRSAARGSAGLRSWRYSASSWTAPERAELIRVIRAKGGLRESEYVRRFDRHRGLREAIGRLARRVPRP